MASLNSNVKLSILHIYPGAKKISDEEMQAEFHPKLDKVKSKMIELSKTMIDASEDKISNVVLAGNVEETMLNFIGENNFDLAIIGINSNGSDNKLGSHAISIIEESNVPVMIVPNNSSESGTGTN